MGIYLKKQLEGKSPLAADEILARRKRMDECKKRVIELIMEEN